jgi:hypothetical protein
MEAKFHENPLKPEIQLSPHVQSLANKVFDTLISVEAPAPGFSRDAWLEWREASKDRREVQVLLDKTSSDPNWVNLSQSERIEYIQTFMAPLKLSKELQSEIVL